MRAIILAVVLALVPAVANAQSDTMATEPVAPIVTESTTAAGSPAEMAPMPSLHRDLDGYRIAAISAGAVGGVMVANVLTGGMATPVLLGTMGNGGAMLMNGGMYLTAASQLAVTAAGAIAGGYFGDWFYYGQ